MTRASTAPPNALLVILVSLGLLLLAPSALEGWQTRQARERGEAWVELHRERAQAALAQQHYDQAEATLAEALAFAPDAVNVRIDLFGVRLARMAAHPESVTSEDLPLLAYMLDMSATATSDTDSKAYWLVASGLLAERHGNAAKARELYEQASASGLPSAHLALANLAQATGDMAGALAAHQAALKAAPKSLKALNNLGVVEVEMGKLDDALGHFEAAIALEDNAASRTNAGNALSLLGRHKEAISHLVRAHELSPASAEILRRLGRALRSDGQNEAAIVAFERSLALAPHDDTSLELGQVFMAVGRADRAIERFSALLEAHPTSLNALFELGRALRAAGRLEEASVLLTRYVQMAQGRPDQAERLSAVRRAFAPPGQPGAIPSGAAQP